jgi:hypothetical protein
MCRGMLRVGMRAFRTDTHSPSGKSVRPRRRTLLVAALAATVTMATPVVTATPSAAASCPSTSVGGQEIGSVGFGQRTVPVKSVTYPAGGVLTPPPSAKVAGVSDLHRPLRARRGSTVITWHVRYGKGCPGSLNPLLTMKPGKKFRVTDERGRQRTYEVDEQIRVPRGQYDPKWFQLDGPRRLTFMTCTDLKKGEFRKTAVVIASPVR